MLFVYRAFQIIAIIFLFGVELGNNLHGPRIKNINKRIREHEKKSTPNLILHQANNPLLHPHLLANPQAGPISALPNPDFPIGMIGNNLHAQIIPTHNK
jgi:hypothetical protein